jgi:phosphoglycolate phosphatase
VTVKGIKAIWINAPSPRRFRLAMIDFDGTLSLLREGWDQIMASLMSEVLRPLPGTHETDAELAEKMREWVYELNGQPTIQQMTILAQEASRRGARALAPAQLKEEYLQRLMREVDGRKARIRSGESQPADWLVPGSFCLLDSLKSRNVPRMLSSGTDLGPLMEEAQLLGISSYFDQGVHGPASDSDGFTKARAVDTVLGRLGASGHELLNVGDGFAETRLTKERGGVAVGVAYDVAQPGNFHPMRTELLRGAGADLILPDLMQCDDLLRWLMDGSVKPERA